MGNGTTTNAYICTSLIALKSSSTLLLKGKKISKFGTVRDQLQAKSIFYFKEPRAQASQSTSIVFLKNSTCAQITQQRTLRVFDFLNKLKAVST